MGIISLCAADPSYSKSKALWIGTRLAHTCHEKCFRNTLCPFFTASHILTERNSTNPILYLDRSWSWTKYFFGPVSEWIKLLLVPYTHYVPYVYICTPVLDVFITEHQTKTFNKEQNVSKNFEWYLWDLSPLFLFKALFWECNQRPQIVSKAGK